MVNLKVWPLVVLGGLAACDSSTSSASGDAPSSSAAGTTAGATATSTASTVASAAPAAASAAPTSIPLSDVPKPSEWNDAEKMPVIGGPPLGCKGHRVREWVRLSCRGYNGSGAYATGVTIAREAPHTYDFGAPGVASLVFRFVPGLRLAATFTWGKASAGRVFEHALGVTWKVGEPEPALRLDGAPEGALPRGNTTEKLCGCLDLSGLGPAACANAKLADQEFAPECVRAFFASGCDAFRGCSMMAPSGLADCLPDEAHYGITGVTSRCGIRCDMAKDECPEGSTCSDQVGSNPVCVAD